MRTIFIDEMHTKTIGQNLWAQCKTEENCDVVLLAGNEGERISAHRCVLSAASDFFRRMFRSKMREGTSNVVKLSSINNDVLQSLVEYCYTSHLVIRNDNVIELLKAEDMLLLSNVVVACSNFLAEQLYPSNCLGFALLAEQHHCESLLQQAKAYILEYFVEVCGTDEFLKLNAEQLCELLVSDDLCVLFEEDIFNGVMTWIHHNLVEREKYKTQLLKLLRIPLLDRTFLIKKFKPICTSTECHQLYVEALEWHLLSDDEKSKENVSVRPRRSFQSIIALADSNDGRKMHFLYFCSQQLKWMKCLKDLEGRTNVGVAIMGGNLYIVGGSDFDRQPLNTVICINLKTMKLKAINPMKECHYGCRAAVVNGYLYAVGGINSRGCHSCTVEKWNPKTNAWILVEPMTICRSNFGIAVFNGHIYVVGGRTAPHTVLNSVECYDPITNVWRATASMVERRCFPGVAVANGLLYVIGGFNNIKTVERYNPQTDEWTMICSLSEKLVCSRSCTTFHDKVIIGYIDRIEEYNAATDEWITNGSLKGLHSIDSIFFYSDKLLRSEFIEN